MSGTPSAGHHIMESVVKSMKALKAPHSAPASKKWTIEVKSMSRTVARRDGILTLQDTRSPRSIPSPRNQVRISCLRTHDGTASIKRNVDKVVAVCRRARLDSNPVVRRSRCRRVPRASARLRSDLLGKQDLIGTADQRHHQYRAPAKLRQAPVSGYRRPYPPGRPPDCRQSRQ